MVVTDAELLLDAIRAHPAEDVPRLMYADWLDDNAGGACPKCLGTGSHALDPYDLANRYGTHRAGVMLDAARCTACDGAGTMTAVNHDRAEFIRVQCDLARTDPRDWLYSWAKRERDLLLANWKAWTPRLSPDTTYELILSPKWAYSGTPAVSFRRGFVSEVHLPIAAFVGGSCPECVNGYVPTDREENRCRYCVCRTCDGTGAIQMGFGGRHGYSPPQTCPSCKGQRVPGRTPGQAAAIFAHPVERVVLTDREPTWTERFGWT